MNSRHVAHRVLPLCGVALSLALAACSKTSQSDPAPELSPAVFAAFFPSGEDNSFELSVRPADVLTPAAEATEDGWMRVTRPDGQGFIDARWLGSTSGGLQAYLVRSNDGGSASQAAVVVVEIDRSTVRRRGFYWTENIRDNAVTLEGDTVRYGGTTIPVAEMLDPTGG